MHAYITGASSGIGKALAEELLNNGHKVTGISRRNTIKHSNYTHQKVDFRSFNQINDFAFTANIEEDIILINNAGLVGPVKPIGHQIGEEILDLNMVNIIAPQILSAKFINKFQGFSNNYQIINISSGAGKHPIDAWSTYCASKAAIDLFSETISKELTDRNINNWEIRAVSPGVVDTEMQVEIRSANEKEFLVRDKFIDLKKDNELKSPQLVAKFIIDVIVNKEKYNGILISARDYIN